MTREDFIKVLSTSIPRIEGKKVYIWGTGNTAVLYQEGFRRLEKEGFEIEGYGDNNEEMWDKTFYGKNVYSADDIAKVKDAVVLIASPQKRVSDAVMVQLKKLGIEVYLLDDYIIKSHGVEVLAVYDSLCGERSKAIYASVIYNRITNRQAYDALYSADQYFVVPAFGRRDPKEVFVDCGGYVGDTIENYLHKRVGMFSKVVSFEPDLGNFHAAKTRRERLIKEWNLRPIDIEVYPYGVGAENATYVIDAYDNNHGLSSKVVTNTTPENSDIAGSKTEGRIVCLDSFFEDKLYTFLKADIESYEYSMLLGAKETITKYRPKIAVCIYHNSVDLYDIAALLKEYVPEYKFAVRHHSYDMDDTVLYAWVD